MDGASIPQIAWSIIGGSFEGKYRKASVIHDVACNAKNRPWQDVHEAFYTAMLAGGAEGIKAKIVCAAVYYFGPRWPRSIELRGVPISEVHSQIASVIQTTDVSDEHLVEIRPPAHTVWTDVGIIFGAPSPTITIDSADISISIVPTPAHISIADFEGLKKAIEEDNMSIDLIRLYAPVTTSK